MEQNTRLIERIVHHHFPIYRISAIIDKGLCIKHCFEVAFESHPKVVIKLMPLAEGSEIIHECNVAQVFREQGLPSPEIFAQEVDGKVFPFAYLIQQWIGGIKLGAFVKTATDTERSQAFEEIGSVYRKMHQLTHSRAGLWSENPYECRYPIAPHDYMFQTEIRNESGKKAMESGLISPGLYEMIVRSWLENLKFLKDHQPCMIHASPFPWNIYLDLQGKDWKVSKLTSMGDVLWWDGVFDCALIRYPPFGKECALHWDSFVRGYGRTPDEKRMALYATMQRLCASMGVYMEPKSFRDDEWVHRSSQEIERFLSMIE